jgi:hypothetical protein
MVISSVCASSFNITYTIIMNPELISGRSVFRSNVVAVCAGKNGRPPFFHTKWFLL